MTDLTPDGISFTLNKSIEHKLHRLVAAGVEVQEINKSLIKINYSQTENDLSS